MSIRFAAAEVYATAVPVEPKIILARAVVSATGAAPPPPAAPRITFATASLANVTQPTTEPRIIFADAKVAASIAVILPPVREVWNGLAWHDITTEVYRNNAWRPLVIERWDGTQWITGPQTSNPPTQPERSAIWSIFI